MLTDAQVYCMTSMIYLFRSPLTVKPFIGKRRKQSCTPNNWFYKKNNYIYLLKDIRIYLLVPLYMPVCIHLCTITIMLRLSYYNTN